MHGTPGVEQARGRPGARLLERLSDAAPLLSVELRPPPVDLSHADSIDTWIDMHHAIRRLTSGDGLVFLTDNAVGQSEEENLHHLAGHLTGVDAGRLVPFLTCKHSLDYCLMYAARAASSGYQALTVLGGDHQEGRPRCLPHAYELRQRIRERVPGLALGGWANPHRDPAEQVAFLLDPSFTAEFYLTQVVSHHDLPAVEAFLEASRAAGVTLPGVFGVFYYRSASPRTLRTLSEFLPVPQEGLARDFAAGLSPEAICARTIHALRRCGVDKVYLSNLGQARAPERMAKIRRELSALEG